MGHLAITKPDKALQGIFHDHALSESSRHTYAQRLMAIPAKLGQPIAELAMQPLTVIPWIKMQYPEVATQKNVVTAVLAALRRMPATKPQHRQALAIWLRASKELEAQQHARLKANEPSARQQRGYVDFKEVIKVHTSLAKGSRSTVGLNAHGVEDLYDLGDGLCEALHLLDQLETVSILRLYDATNINVVQLAKEQRADLKGHIIYSLSLAIAGVACGHLLENYYRGETVKQQSMAEGDRPAQRPAVEACDRLGLNFSAKQLIEDYGVENLHIGKQPMSASSSVRAAEPHIWVPHTQRNTAWVLSSAPPRHKLGQPAGF
ncbi:TPA: hypothetical protein ACH3X1_003557 [Trebouxia sp. C0004]